MKLFKSLLLASATGMVAVSGASAADLGAKKPSPVEYVRACYNPLWGTSGGFIVPGTQTCLRVFGAARFDIGYAQPFNRTNSPMGYRGGLTMGLDAITPSEYGNVRAFASIAATFRTGNQNSGTSNRLGIAFGTVNNNGTNVAGQTEIIATGFIQFAGFTMGRTASFFRTVGRPNDVIGTTWLSDPGNVNTIAYTAQLGNGFLATIALEDPTIRRYPVVFGTAYTAGGVAIASSQTGPAPFGVSFSNVAPGLAGANAGFAQQVGNRMPNIVAALRVDQAWGSAELSGMVNEVGLIGAVAGIAGSPAAGLVFSPSTKYGYAINGGLKINLPMLAAGSNLTLNGAYSEGNLSAVLSNGAGYPNGFYNFGGVAAVAADATFNRGNGQFRLTKAWSVTAGIQHFWTPTLNSSLFGSYAAVDTANIPGDAGDYLRDFKMWTVGFNTNWQPVRGLNILGEVAYQNISVSGRVIDVNKHTQVTNAINVAGCNFVTGVGCRLKSQDGALVGRFRVVRDF